jgi:FkbM family methyltransferase
MTETVALPLAEIAAADPGYGRRVIDALNHVRDAGHDREDLLQFLAFALPRARASKSQIFQDLWALWEADGKRGGYFVEFGAAGGVWLSNSWYLEKEMGWSGILAEPNPVFAKSLARERRCSISNKAVFSRSGDQVEFLAVRSAELSRIAAVASADHHDHKRVADSETIVVETISLNDLLVEQAAPRVIDFMSVDTEGSEHAILEAFDFDRWDVRTLAVEHNKTPAREAIFKLLTARGYRRKWREISRFDDWYVKA